jgi:hypothetical protein
MVSKSLMTEFSGSGEEDVKGGMRICDQESPDVEDTLDSEDEVVCLARRN